MQENEIDLKRYNVHCAGLAVYPPGHIVGAVVGLDVNAAFLQLESWVGESGIYLFYLTPAGVLTGNGADENSEL